MMKACGRRFSLKDAYGNGHAFRCAVVEGVSHRSHWAPLAKESASAAAYLAACRDLQRSAARSSGLVADRGASARADRLGRALIVNLWSDILGDGTKEAEQLFGTLSRMLESRRLTEKDEAFGRSPKRWLPKKGGR